MLQTLASAFFRLQKLNSDHTKHNACDWGVGGGGAVSLFLKFLVC
jgi:hypothetical protein